MIVYVFVFVVSFGNNFLYFKYDELNLCSSTNGVASFFVGFALFAYDVSIVFVCFGMFIDIDWYCCVIVIVVGFLSLCILGGKKFGKFVVDVVCVVVVMCFVCCVFVCVCGVVCVVCVGIV